MSLRNRLSAGFRVFECKKHRLFAAYESMTPRTPAETLAFCRIMFPPKPQPCGEQMAVKCAHRTHRRERNLVLRAACRHTGCVPTDGAGWNRLLLAYAEHREDACHYYSSYAWNMLNLLITALWCLRNAFVTVFVGQTRIAWKATVGRGFCEG